MAFGSNGHAHNVIAALEKQHPDAKTAKEKTIQIILTQNKLKKEQSK